jgi:hypothetical protein
MNADKIKAKAVISMDTHPRLSAAWLLPLKGTQIRLKNQAQGCTAV